MNGEKGENFLNQPRKNPKQETDSSPSHTNEWGNLSDSRLIRLKQENDFLPLPYKLMLN